jgi:hypothetical protein
MGLRESYSSPSGGIRSKRRLGIIIVVVVLLLGVLTLSSHLGSPPFNIVGTTPKLKNMTTKARSLAVNFSQPISAKGLSITSSPSIVTSSNISGKTLTLRLAADTLLNTKTYVITIKSVSDTSGTQLLNQKLSFTPVHVGAVFVNEYALYSVGLSTNQASILNSYLSQFKPWASTVTVNTSSIKHYLDSPSDPWSPWDVSCTVSIDGTNYNVITSYDNTNSLQLKVFDPTSGNQLFAAGSVGSF